MYSKADPPRADSLVGQELFSPVGPSSSAAAPPTTMPWVKAESVNSPLGVKARSAK